MVKHSKEQILNLRKEGKSYKEIREIVKCTKSLISYYCKNVGLAHSNIKSKPTEQDIITINAKYKEGLTLSQIEKFVPFKRHTISKYITEKKKTVTKCEAVVSWRKRRKKDLVEYKGGKCEKCGYNKSVEALQFHHINPLDKDFTISGKSWSFEKLKEEVDKCIMLCANCHLEEHERLKIDGLVAQG